MLFFGSRCERLCLTQFSLVSLIPRLLHNLQDSAGPELDSYERSLTMPTSLRTSDRNSLLSYMGLPLQIFDKGSLFGPYTPLQQLDILADFGTKSYIVGSTNSLLLQQKDRYSDILINLDEGTINVTSPSLRAALQLSTPDRRWIDFITQNVNDTWDEANPSRPKTMGYVGSEEFIRVQFEEYLLALISSVKYRAHLARHANNPRMLLPDIDGDPSHDFGNDFVEAWSRTQNFRIWNSHTDSHLFDIVEPKHPCAGGLTIEDIQRRITQQVQDLHWDERFAQGREALGRNLAAGREKASTLFGKLYADMEALREAQRRKSEEAKSAQSRDGASPTAGSHGQDQQEKNGAVPAVDFTKAQQTMQAVGSKAGAFVNSWAAWAGEKRRAAWGGGKSSSSSSTTTTTTTNNSSGDAPSNNTNSSSSGGGGWASGWVRIGSSSGSSNSNKNRASSPQSPRGGYDALPSQPSDRASIISSASRRSTDASDRAAEQRPLNTNRFSAASTSGESMLDDAAATAERASVPPSSLTPPRSPPGKEGSGKSEVGPERGRIDIGGEQQRKNKEEQGEEEEGSRSKEEGIERDPKPDSNPKPELESGPEPGPSPTLSPNPAVAEAAEVQELWNRR
ncbi:hypothetical protein MYCTH_2309831 [Thermothelomyces thermophilus ATCC 42464]|uniref:UDENN domain-containing protein n=1 Tax=Thermothelomyces thermophilus (strain ATCC 42464 / BCRC 31852 / DSM 1799) TaxID=573729 RepID=G2QKS0_THET4|nr:uncharacterized protein MYCTH_2309831 [Thermothelomyces thermophilus ATCC 42464]AEO60552.1 hypothetical protein MYCTH_2309831 [Thermothelomyces thermophilus ATCC 42464]